MKIETLLFNPEYDPFKKEQSLTQEDYERCAQQLNCEVAAVKAVAEVESRGSGFLGHGRPKILFERHIFRRLTHRRFDSNQAISSSSPGGYFGGDKEYSRLRAAFKLNRIAALKSTSWGKFQIMGFNYADCGYDSVEAYVSDMCISEQRHLSAFVTLIQSWNLDVTLQRHQWARFAKRYNGPAYKKNAYHTKLAGAYEKHLCKHSINTVRDLQRTLNELGFDCGTVDGLHGPKTAAAIMRFEFKARLPGVGKPTEKLMAAVQAVREFADE